MFKYSPSAFDLELLQKFIHSVGIYPIGTLVRLNSGFLAIVAESAKQDLTRPVVKMIHDIKKNRPITPRNLDLCDGVGKLHEIVSAEDPHKWKINIASYL